jgi:GLPGLI family protein
MKNIILLAILFQSFIGFSQTKNFKITYLKSSNDKVIENQDTTLVFVNEKQCLISSKKIINNKAEFPYEQTLVQGTNLFQMASLKANKVIFSIDSISISKQKLELTNETKKILGYQCKKATTVINSNRIDIWYTNELSLKGGPSALGQNLGLVLETNRNGNFLVTAIKIEKTKNFPKLNAIENRKNSLDNLTYKDLLWKSRFVTIPVFKDEIINFSDKSKSNDSIMRFGNGTIVLRKIKFPEIITGSQIFIDLIEQSNGDAYDRTGSAFIIPMQKKQSFLDGLQNGAKVLPVYTCGNNKEYQGVVATKDYLPLIELMRFFTPFGIKQYNYLELKDKKWYESVPYRQDISDLILSLSNQEVYIGAFIGNYDNGGHKISMNITIHNEEDSKNKKLQIIPLFNTLNVMESAGQNYGTMFNTEKGLEVQFSLDTDLKNARLRYITTGHGGWENGDEFVPKSNTIELNNVQLFSFTPWRQDCGSYRLFNPASGNFPNGLSSSDYSRANWCPGATTNPIYIDLGNLKAGNYTLKVKIPQGENEGNSFSSWNVSGVLLGE